MQLPPAAPRQQPPANSLPANMGTERGPCYPNHTCNDTLKCLSDLCVRLESDTSPDSVSGAAAQSPDSTQRLSSGASKNPAVRLGDLNSASSAEPTLRTWKGLRVRIVTKTRQVLEGKLAGIRLLRLYMEDGSDFGLEDLIEASLLE